MYSIYGVNDNKRFLLHNINIESLNVIEPKLTLEVNMASQLLFKIPCTHIEYDSLYSLKTYIIVEKDNVEIFAGRIITMAEDIYRTRQVTCEGELAYFNDSIQDPAEYHNIGVRDYLTQLVNNHNSQVGREKQFVVGNVTVKDSNDSLYRYSNFESTLFLMKDRLISRLGGYFVIRKENGVRYLDYLEDYAAISRQTIQFGVNLLDYNSNINAIDLATAVIPLGARLEEKKIEALESYTTIESVNGGLNYIESTEAVSRFGRIVKVAKFDDVTLPENLIQKGREYLKDIQFETVYIEVKFANLHNVDSSIDDVNIGEKIRCISMLHGMDRVFKISKMVIPLDNPSDTNIVLGETFKRTLTEQSVNKDNEVLSIIDSMPNKGAILEEAKKNTITLITEATKGNVSLSPDELLVMDEKDKNKASKIFRWDSTGLCYSNDGYSYAKIFDIKTGKLEGYTPNDEFQNLLKRVEKLEGGNR